MIETSRQGAVDVLQPQEPLAREGLEELRTLLEDRFLDGQPMVVLSLESVPLIDSAGLELLLSAQENLERRRGAMKLAAPNALCRDILRTTGVGDRFEVYDEVKAAVGSFLR